MKFSGLLRPIHDETFPSWVTRCAVNPRIFPVTENDIYDWVACDSRKSFIASDMLGMEFDFSDSQGVEIAGKLGLQLPMVKRFFRPSSDLLLSRGYRSAYCHRCIQSDVESKRYPSWRKSWCYVDRPYCLQHRCLLCFVNDCDLANKQWIAFAKGDLGDFMPGRRRGYYSRRPGLIPNASRAWLTLRVQEWIGSLYRSEFSFLPGTNTTVESMELIRAVKLILCMLLVPRTDRTPPGLAKDMFSCANAVIVHKILDLNQRLEYGAVNSLPYERMSALLLLGLTFKIFNQTEIACFKRQVISEEFIWPSNRQWLGMYCADHVSFEERGELKELFSFPEEIMDFLDQFLDGLFGGYGKI